MKKSILLAVFLQFCLFLSGNSRGQTTTYPSGTLNVTETWTLKIVYHDFGETAHYSGTYTNGGTKTGKITVNNGYYVLNNAGVNSILWTQLNAGVQGGQITRRIAKVGSAYVITGGTNVAGFTLGGNVVASGVNIVGVSPPTLKYVGAALAGCFAIGFDLKGDELISSSNDYQDYHANGLADAVFGGGHYNSSDYQVTVTSVIKITEAPAEKIAPTIKIAGALNNKHVTSSLIDLTGTASDNVGVARVEYAVGAGAYQTATGTTTWAVTNLPLAPGANVIKVRSVDTSGNTSAISTITVYLDVVSAPQVQVTAGGSISPNYNNSNLVVGATYNMTAKANQGFSFVGWILSGTSAGTKTNTTPALKFTNDFGLNIVAVFKDSTAPEVTIQSPKNNAKLNIQHVTISGTAKDNDKVREVLVQVNNRPWQLAAGTNNWSLAVDLDAGPNTIRVLAEDNRGSNGRSKTNSITVTYVVSAPFSGTVAGPGKIVPTLSANLEVGKSYTITATPNPQSKFSYWSKDGFAFSSTNKLTFTMTTNGFSVVANFGEGVAPTVNITSPKANGKIGSETTMTGTASDNSLISRVFYRVDNHPFTPATQTGANWSTWSANIDGLDMGSHTFQAYACDAAGNYSKTNSVTVSFPSYKGIYMGVYATTSNPPINGIVAAMIRSDNSVVIIGGTLNFTNTDSFHFETMIAPDGSFIFGEENNATGKVTSAGITGAFHSEVSGTFTLSKKPDTGAQSANVGFYSNFDSPDVVETGLILGILAADGTFIFNVDSDHTNNDGGEGDGGDHRRGAGKVAISASNAISGTVDTSRPTTVTGTLNASDHVINGHYKNSKDEGDFAVNRTLTLTVEGAVGAAP